MPDDPEIPQSASLHKTAAFWRLMGLFKRQDHPAFDMGTVAGDDDGTGASYADWWKNTFTPGQDRNARYRIFEEMDSGLVASILDVYSEETTQPDYDKGQAVWIESDNHNLVKAGEECLRNIMTEDGISARARRLCKKGDDFTRLIYHTGRGVLGQFHCQPEKMMRVADKFGRLVGFKEEGVKFREGKRAVSWPWDYVHYRLLGGKGDESGYGTSILDSLFNPWRQLTLAEDAVLMYRMRRAPDRNMILVDVNNMEEAEAMAYVNTWRKKFRKAEFIDPASPNYRKQYNPMSPIEDIFMPIRGTNNSTRIENLSGSASSDQLFDLDHFRRKFFGTSRVPQAFLGFEGDINAKATLTTQDVRFARACKRVQKALVCGLRQTVDVHLSLLNINMDPEQVQKYLIKMSPISYLDEFERLELMRLRFEIMEAMSNIAQGLHLDVRVWSQYILLNYAKLPENLVLKLIAKPQAPPTPMGPDSGSDNAVEGTRHKRRARDLNETSETGYYDLSKAEQQQIAEAVHRSAGLRKAIGNLHELCIEDAIFQQTDASMIPPARMVVEDEMKDSEEILALKRDLNEEREKKKAPSLNEG